jgi:lipoprotein-anchoring transpeptidase ErfK/SrfK
VSPRRCSLRLGAPVLSLLVAGALVAPVAAGGTEATATFRNAGVGAAVASSPDPSPAADAAAVELSNEWTLTRWAFVTSPADVHAKPAADSAVLERLSTQTHDRTPELVLALAQVTTGNDTWVEVRFKVRPNGQTGWVHRSNLGPFREVDTFLRIRRGKFRATLYDGGRRVWSAPIGIGQKRWPTPAGRFYARERLIPTDKDSVYGIFAFGISATSPALTDWPGGGIIGIHGTNQPELIPGRISHGCIRVPNPKIAKLRRLMPLGTPIEIV